MPCYAYQGIVPMVNPTSYVHPLASLIGDVILGSSCFIAPGASLRGDFGRRSGYTVFQATPGLPFQAICGGLTMTPSSGSRVRGLCPARFRRQPWPAFADPGGGMTFVTFKE